MSQLYVGGNLVLDNRIRTTETKTGMTYSGKPIYQLTWTASAAPTISGQRAAVTAAKTITNMEKYIYGFGTAKMNGGTYDGRTFDLSSYAINTDLTFLVCGTIRIEGTTVTALFFIKNGNLTPTTVDITMTAFYTKTTD